MKLTASHIGGMIKVINSNGHMDIKTGSKYQIENVISDGTVIKLKGVDLNWYCREKDYVIVSLPKQYMPPIFTFTNPSVGDTVTLVKSYYSIKGGGAAVVEEVIDESRIRVKGCLPGGFIYTKDIIRKIDMTILRVKTLDEIILDFGILLASRTYFSERHLNIYGKNLNEIDAVQINSDIICGDFFIAREIIVKATDPYRECEIYFSDGPFPIEYLNKSVLEVCPDLTITKLAHVLSGSSTIKSKHIGFSIKIDYLSQRLKGSGSEELPF